ncbi:MAG: hypothetical protein J6T35_07510 [Bacteroidales bacterium]|nr:hypothetical protein [Bacteroidales bacterium]
MKNDDLWMVRYGEVLDFMKSRRRNPSKHRIEEHLMLNWMKYNRKMMNAGKLKADRERLFKEVLAIFGITLLTMPAVWLVEKKMKWVVGEVVVRIPTNKVTLFTLKSLMMFFLQFSLLTLLMSVMFPVF